MNEKKGKILDQIVTDSAADSEVVMLDHLLSQVNKKRRRRLIIRTGAALCAIAAIAYTTLNYQSTEVGSQNDVVQTIQPTEKAWTEITSKSEYTEIKTEDWAETLVSRSSIPRLVILDDFNLLQQFGDRPVMLVDSKERPGKELIFLDTLEKESPL